MYWTLIKFSFKQQLQYKWDLLFQILGDWFWVYIKVCIWQALLMLGNVGKIDFKDMVAYSIIGLLMLLLTNSRVASDLADRVRTGMIAVDLIRPLSLKWYYFFGQLGENLFHFLTEGILIAVVSSFIWKFPYPSIETICVCFFCLLLGVLIMFYIQYNIGLLVFWMKDGTYTRMMTRALFVLFSGIEIPLWFYPDWLKQICSFLPFRFIVFEPITIWLGQTQIQETVKVIFMQILWILLLTWVEKRLWSKIQNNIEIQGG